MLVENNGLSFLIQLTPILVLLYAASQAAIGGVVASQLAKSRGLNIVAAVFAGIFGGFAALFLIAMLPKK